MKKIHGEIELIVGGMFSGKSTELIRRARLYSYAKRDVRVFKHEIDTRYDVSKISSHTKEMLGATPIANAYELGLATDGMKEGVVVIDEIQFFEEDIIEVCERLSEAGVRVLAAGLDKDSTGKEFKFMGKLMALADEVTKLRAVCVKCGSLASYSSRIKKREGTVYVGAASEYEAMCRSCFTEAVKN